MTITGKDLIGLGFPPGKNMGWALKTVNGLGLEGDALRAWVEAHKPPPQLPLQDAPDFVLNLEAETEAEAENVSAVQRTMQALMRTPTVRAGAVMPDACPAGPMGTIPVGGVVATENAIHPGMHSADICCSVMLTDLGQVAPKLVLDEMQKVTHFGPGGRRNGQRFTLSPKLLDAFRGNMFLKDAKIVQAAQEHLGTQGDGNHFAFVGTSAKTGNTCLVTHHGSRGPGAGLYKLGKRVAEKFRKQLSPATLKHNAWIPFETPEGQAYWEALQLIRKWTKANHNGLHQAVAEGLNVGVQDRFWNEHNFVFRKADLFYHAKGATPLLPEFLPDSAGMQIIPLNMAEPILLVQGLETTRNLGFAPHGAGRNMSRTAHKRLHADKTNEALFAQETQHIDARFFSGNIDVSELPSAYKSAATVRAQMERFDLAEVVDEIHPYGSIMAGDWERDAPWRKKARAKHAARAEANRTGKLNE